MSKKVYVQSYGTLKVASFPGCLVTKISTLANMKYFVAIGKSIKNVTKNA